MSAHLTEQDLAALAKSFITPELAEQARLFRVDAAGGAMLVGRNGRGDYSGIAFPYIWPGETSVREYRLRRYHPEFEQQPDGTLKEKNKYMSPPGRANHLYFVPGTQPEWLDDTSLPAVISEGEKKIIALYRLAFHEVESNEPRFLPAGLSGVWNWRGTVGKTVDEQGARCDVKGPIPDLDLLAWQGRITYIVFDTNVVTNESVWAARRELARELKRRGAVVRLIDLPQTEGVNGVDDLLTVKGPDFVLSLFTGLEKLRQDQREEQEYAARVYADLEAAAIEDEREPFTTPKKAEDKSAYEMIDELSAGLAADAQAWLCAMFWLMTAAKYSEDIRAFVLAIAALSFARESGPTGVELSDPELAEFLGCSESTVQRRRRKYKEESRKFSVIAITEGDFDKELGKNRSTRYVFLRGQDAADAVLEARKMALWETDTQEAIKISAFRVFNSVPGAPRANRQRKKKTYSPETVKEALRKTIRTNLRKLLELEGINGDSLEAYKTLRAELDEIANFSENSPQASDGKEVNPTGEQSAYPSDGDDREGHGATYNNNSRPTTPPDFVLPVGISVDDALRTPSIARQWRAAMGERRPAQPSAGSERASPQEAEIHHTTENEEVICGPALWVGAHDGDMPVTVTGEWGVANDGRRYVSIAEASGGVPFDEIRYTEFKGG